MDTTGSITHSNSTHLNAGNGDMAQETMRSTLLNGVVQLRQPQQGFRVGIDTVMVAAFADIAPNNHILDAGCGVGGAGLCAYRRVPSIASLHGIEIDPFYAHLAQENYVLNDVAQAHVYETDIRKPIESLKEQIDYIICNPPYMMAGDHQRSENLSKARAMGQGEGEASLSDWGRAFKFYLRRGGGFSLIQRADKLDIILELLAHDFGALELLPLYSKQGSTEAKRILLRGRKGRKTPFKILHPVIVHEDNGDYTKQIDNVLRGGYALP